MTEDTTSLVLEHLRHIRSQIDALRLDMGDVKLRLTVIEGHIASLVVGQTGHNSEMDRLKIRIDRIERRLELTEGPAPV